MFMTMKRQRWIPADSVAVEHDGGVAYKYASAAGKLCAVAYQGKATKAAWHHLFRDEAARDKKIAEFFKSVDEHKALRAQYAAQRNAPHSLKVDDVIYNSWGYDQTNVDFYKVVRASKNFVWIQPIGSKEVSGSQGQMSAMVVADPGVTGSGPVTMHKADASGYVSFKYGAGGKWDGKPIYSSWYA